LKKQCGDPLKTVWYLTQNSSVFGVKHRGVFEKQFGVFSQIPHCFLEVKTLPEHALSRVLENLLAITASMALKNRGKSAVSGGENS
jgi:hypothetical protein